MKSTITQTDISPNSTFAIFEHKNQQYKVQVGSVVFLDLDQNCEAKQALVFTKVLMLNDQIGQPYLAKVQVIGKCLAPEVKGKKIVVFKYKSKKNYRVRTGHRAKYTKVLIEKFEQQ